MGRWRSSEELARLAKAKAKRMKKSAAATVKAEPARPVVVFKSAAPELPATGERNNDKGVEKMSKTKISKSVENASARAAIAAAADALDRYASEPGVSGLVSKLRAAIEAPSVPDDGNTLASAMLDGAVTSTYRTNTSKVEQALGRMTELRKRDDLTPEAQEAVRKASRDLQTEYLHAVSPGAAQSVEEYRAADARRYAAQTGGVGPAVVGDDSAIRKAAAKLQKADSALSEVRGARARIQGGSCCLTVKAWRSQWLAPPSVERPSRGDLVSPPRIPRSRRCPAAAAGSRAILHNVRSAGSCHRSDFVARRTAGIMGPRCTSSRSRRFASPSAPAGPRASFDRRARPGRLMVVPGSSAQPREGHVLARFARVPSGVFLVPRAGGARATRYRKL